VDRYRGETAAPEGRDVTVIVEQVVVEEVDEAPGPPAAEPVIDEAVYEQEPEATARKSATARKRSASTKKSEG
jgi:hypothetical protein